jgi:ribosomal protein S18 acetylase RimI-like enzyme
MTIPVRRLWKSGRAAFERHLLALDTADLRLRFGIPLSRDRIAAYAAAIDLAVDRIYAVFDDRLEVVGAVHLGVAHGVAELGLSVSRGHRRRGLGSALFARVVQHARNRGMRRIYMHCLAENQAVIAIARRAGMRIVVSAGEADAFLKVPAADAESLSGEFVADQLALFDYGLKAQVDSLRRIDEALRAG